MSRKKFIIGLEPLTIETVVDIAYKRVEVELCSDASYKEKINNGPQFLDEMLEKEKQLKINRLAQEV